MLEFFDITIKFTHNRGFSHELVRPRMCSFAQESTRYCNYSNDKFDNELTLIEPYWGTTLAKESNIGIAWLAEMRRIEALYMQMLKEGLPPQAARGILPNDLKTEIVVKANLREWKHILELRCAPGAHPDMQRIMIPLHKELHDMLPEIF
jgi:thymidylate synthase (FAD)